MAETFRSRFKRAWSAFSPRDDSEYMNIGPSVSGNSIQPFRSRTYSVNRETIIIPIYNRIAIDVASVDIRHIRVDLDNDDRYIEDIRSYLYECLTLEPNIDQASEAFFRDAIQMLCEFGVIAIVPVEVRGDPINGEAYDPTELRIGTITQWFPRHVRINLYNDQTGLYQEVTLPKKMVAIVENPLYAVMNDHNSILQRLVRKLAILDVVDEQSGSGKLDVIIQLPYVIKSETRKAQAQERRESLEQQLANSKYGVGYIDATERITQLNRPAENNLMGQVEFLTEMLYDQLGITKAVIDGTADEATMINYFNRTIEPFLAALTQAMTRTFLSRTARAQGQRIHYYRDPFKLVPVSQLADIADKFTRNEIATSNEFRTKGLGWKPANDPKADELVNANISQPKQELETAETDVIDGEIIEDDETSGDNLQQELDSMISEIDDILLELEE